MLNNKIVRFLINAIIPGAFEQKLAEMADDDERKAYQEETKCNTNLEKIIVQVYTPFFHYCCCCIDMYTDEIQL